MFLEWIRQVQSTGHRVFGEGEITRGKPGVLMDLPWIIGYGLGFLRRIEVVGPAQAQHRATVGVEPLSEIGGGVVLLVEDGTLGHFSLGLVELRELGL